MMRPRKSNPRKMLVDTRLTYAILCVKPRPHQLNRDICIGPTSRDVATTWAYACGRFVHYRD
jgi:hypothetical protein